MGTGTSTSKSAMQQLNKWTWHRKHVIRAKVMDEETLDTQAAGIVSMERDLHHLGAQLRKAP
jgi:uncharacterized protein (UPF0548 family)